jgi:hypothetical protein
VQIYNYYQQPHYPVISLEEDEAVTLKFDDLSNKEETYTYKMVLELKNKESRDITPKSASNDEMKLIVDIFNKNILR